MLPADKAVLTGTPIRTELSEGSKQAGRDFCGFTDDKPVLMVIGGSLGAQSVNETVRYALPKLLKEYNIVHICGKEKMDNLKLSARFIESLEFYNNEKVVIGTVTQNDFRELNLNIDHVEGFSSIIMNISGVKLGVILVELKDNIKISFRSKGEIKVNELAVEFDGGGHKNAAGANVRNTTLKELKENILKRINKYLD